jgi:uncharacterized protein (DUF2164 family)
MSLDLPTTSRQEAIASIQRYFSEEIGEELGNIAAGGLLDFFLAEIGPSVYNKAVADVQQRVQSTLSEIDVHVHQDEFSYWIKNRRRR